MKLGSFVSMCARPASRMARARSLLLSASLLALGCSEPRYDTELGGAPDRGDAGAGLRRMDAMVEPPSDARVAADTGVGPSPVDAAATDAGTLASADAGVLDRLTENERRLVGRYAMLRRYLGRSTYSSDLGKFVEDTYALVEIAPDGDAKLKLKYEQCTSATRVDSAVLARLDNVPLRPDRVPPRQLDVQVDGDVFYTEGPPHLIGYEEKSPAGCSPGAKLASPDKPWLPSGFCTCAGSTTLPPTQSDDCRIVDSDDDREPGYTMRMTGGGLASSDQFVRTKEVSQYVQGKIVSPSDGRKHSARYSVMREDLTLDCEGTCPSWGVLGCPAQHNAVFFEPIPSDHGCAEIVREVDSRRLLVREAPEFPSGC